MPVLEVEQEMEIAFSPLLHRYTLEEFWRLPEPEDRSTLEMIDGVIYMAPPPDPPHGDIGSRLTLSVANFIAANKSKGDVYHPREPIYVDSTYFEPDMMYVSEEMKAKMGARRTSADIVFEYLSKTTANYDRTTKADTYLALGVRELWLVDPATQTIEVRHAMKPAKEGDLPRWKTIRYGTGELAESRVLAGWRVSADDQFAGLI